VTVIPVSAENGTGHFWNGSGLRGVECVAFEHEPEGWGVKRGVRGSVCSGFRGGDLVESVGAFFDLEVEGLVVHRGGDAVEKFGAVEAAPTGARIPARSGGVEGRVRTVGRVVVAGADVISDGAAELIEQRIEKAEWDTECAANDGVESGEKRAGTTCTSESKLAAVDEEPIVGAGAAVGNHGSDVGDAAFVSGVVAFRVGDAGDAGGGLIERDGKVLAGAATRRACETAYGGRGPFVAPGDFRADGGGRSGVDGENGAADGCDPGIAAGIGDVRVAVGIFVVAAEVLGNHEETDANSRERLEQCGHLMCGGAGVRDITDAAGLVAGPEIKAAGHDSGLAFSFGKQDAIQANEQTLLGDFGEVDVDGCALRDGGGGRNILSDFLRERVGGGDGAGCVEVGVGADGEADVVKRSGSGAIGGVREIGEVIVRDVVGEVAGESLVCCADGIRRSDDADDLIGGSGVGEIVQSGDGGNGKRSGTRGIAGTCARAADGAIVESYHGDDDSAEFVRDEDGAFVAAVHVGFEGRLFGGALRGVFLQTNVGCGALRFVAIESDAEGGVKLRGGA
jgi:hypothetical protein